MAKRSKSPGDRAKMPNPDPAAASPEGGKAQQGFPIVGIGASAGGLEAIEKFLAHVPPKTGMAFIIVQHLDPNHDCIMASLLQKGTALPVEEIKDRTKVKPGHVYLIPPNQDLSILHGVLHLFEPTAPRGLRLPIDFFLRSLAEDQKNLSIGVILSGMGSDGSQALRSIKEKAGGIFVQEPASAKFDGMPRSAIDSGLADVVAPVEELPAKIINYLQSLSLVSEKSEVDVKSKDKSGLEKVILLLRTHTGHDFSLYKKSTMYRRIERRMGLHQLARIADYVRFLKGNPQEANLLFKELLIGVTSFFRDPEVWEQLKTEVIPELLAARPNGGVLRAWVPGCSTGEEAYSLAMLFNEVLEQVKPTAQFSLQIFATDLDKEAIDQARSGAFQANILADVSRERLQRFFIEDERGYRVRQEIREMVIFAPQNLVMDPPFTKLDLLTCRNLLIYLETALQKKLLKLFHYSINPDGILVLGSAETTGQSTELFKSLPGKSRIYRRQNSTGLADLIGFPEAFTQRRTVPRADAEAPVTALATPNLQAMTDALLLSHYTPAAVLTTDQGDILYITGKTGKYLEPAIGKANLNIFAMARDGLNSLLHEAFHRALRQKSKVSLAGVQIGVNGGTQTVDVSVQPLDEPEALHGSVLIVFTDVAVLPTSKASATGNAPSQSPKFKALSQELQQAREDLQITREEMQSSQEELKSANEELQSTNEELQSTNEELTTSKEEMQSMNEELQTVNQELQAKVDELSLVSDDMKNLLNSTEIATLFLDGNLKVRRFTAETTKLIKLIPGDAGRPISDIVSDLNYPDLVGNSREVLRSLTPHQQQVSASRGRWFEVRIMPYRTQDNRIDGVVITFINITELKAQENFLTEALTALELDFETAPESQNRAEMLESAVLKTRAVLEGLIVKQDIFKRSP